MGIWPFDPKTNADIGIGLFHWLGDQIANIRMALWIRRSKRIDGLIERANRASAAGDAAEKRVRRET